MSRSGCDSDTHAQRENLTTFRSSFSISQFTRAEDVSREAHIQLIFNLQPAVWFSVESHSQTAFQIYQHELIQLHAQTYCTQMGDEQSISTFISPQPWKVYKMPLQIVDECLATISWMSIKTAITQSADGLLQQDPRQEM